MDGIRDAGYDVFLILEVTIGFHPRKQDEAAADGPAVVESGDLVLSAQDAQFLQSLRITLGGPGESHPKKD